jgi:hypothetical protein
LAQYGFDLGYVSFVVILMDIVSEDLLTHVSGIVFQLLDFASPLIEHKHSQERGNAHDAVKDLLVVHGLLLENNFRCHIDMRQE